MLKKFETIIHHTIARLLQAVAIFIVIGIPILLVIVRTHGLGDTVRKRVEKAISGQFYEVKIHRLLFSISDGLIAENLRVQEKSASHRLLAHASRVTILPKLSSLSTGGVEIESFQLHHATIDVPLGNTQEPRLRLDHVEAKIICPPEQLTLSNARFELCGIHVHASGNFLNPKTFAPHPVASEGPGKIAQIIELIQEQLQRIQWDEMAPSLEIEASGDLTKIESLHADHITFRSGSCSYGPWQLKSISADLDYANLALKLQHLSLEDHCGEFHISGNADFKNKEASLNFSGSCDVASLSTLLASKSPLADCVWIDPPHLEGALSAVWKKEPVDFQAEAHLAAERFAYRGIEMKSLSGGCIFREGRFLARDFYVTGSPGSLTLDFMAAPDDYRVRINAALFPQLIAPAVKGNLQTTLALMNFQDPLKITFEGHAPKSDPLLLEGSGTLTAGRSAMRGSAIDGLSAAFQVKDESIDFQNIAAHVGEKTAQGECIYDIKNKEIRFPGITSRLDPVAVMMWIDPRIAESLKDYRFHQTPDLSVTGCIGLKDPQKNNFKIDIKAPEGLDYTLIKRELSFMSVVGTAAIKKQELRIDIPQALLFDGPIALKVHASIVPGDGRYGADVHLENVDFKSITKLYFDYNNSEGKLSGNYSFTTITGDDYAMVGKGNLVIKDGNVLAMPIFGPLSDLMNDILPGLGYQAARRATADLTVQKGIINTKNLSIQSAEFSMIGFGDIYYLEDRMNMSIRLNVQGIPGLVLFPVSKLFEYVSDGSLKHPGWRSKFVTLPKIPTL